MRIYIFLNKHLSNPQKIVQAVHLGVESGRTFDLSEEHPSVIVLAIELKDIEKIKEYLNKKSIRCVDFYEPLLKSVTGLATEPISLDTGKFLQHFPTIKEKDFMVLDSFPVWHPPLPEGYKSAPLSKEEEAAFTELMEIEKNIK